MIGQPETGDQEYNLFTFNMPDTDITTATDIANITTTEINKMTRETAHQTLKKAVIVMKQDPQVNISEMLMKMQQDNSDNFKLLYERLDKLADIIKDDIRKEYDPQIESLKEEGKNLHNAVRKQQSFIEQLDVAQRANKLIITGIPEDEPLVSPSGFHSPSTTDEDKCQVILSIIGCTPEIQDVCRLGTRIDQGCRPVKVTLVKQGERQGILENAAQLSSKCSPFREMRIKRDSHPAVRAEWARLHEVLKKEKEKGENTGYPVTIDYKRREIIRNGITIDSFINPFI